MKKLILTFCSIFAVASAHAGVSGTNASNMTYSGSNNFTGPLKKNGVDIVSGTSIPYATTSGSATLSGSSVNSGTASYSTTSGSAALSGTASYATTSGSAATSGTAAFFTNSQPLGPANKIVTVSTETDRYALTGSSVNPLDWCKVTTPDMDGVRNVYGVVSLNGTSALSTDLYWLHLGAFLLVPTNTAAPELSGTTVAVGLAVTTGTGTWTDFPTSFAYNWQISATGTSAWSNISSGTTNSYTPITGDIGSYLRCGVAATNGAGTSSAVYTNVSGTVSASTLTSGLVASWHMEEASGVRVDSTGNGNDLADTNSVGQTTGIINNCAQFDGASNYLSNSYNLGSGAFSFSMWVKWLSPHTGSYRTALGANDDDPSEIWQGASDSSEETWLYFQGDNTAHASFVVGDWNHVVGTFDGVDTVKFYFNNTLIDTITVSPSPSGSGTLSFGSKTGGLQYGDCLIDEVLIYDRPINDTEVSQLYDSGAGVSVP